jgi:hypothetical protein
MAPPLIPEQPRLPVRMAAAIVAQGIRIRLGRSLVTVTGIVLGIAFLASILGSQALRRGMADEDRLRDEASRMYGYLVAEAGNIRQRPIAVLLNGEPSGVEERLLQRLEQEQPSELRLWGSSRALPARTLSRLRPRSVTDAADLLDGAACLLVIGAVAPSARQLDHDAITSRRAIVAVTRVPQGEAWQSLRPVALQRELGDEDRKRRDATLARERFRGAWIIGISLVVTVFGITNAMLMSVTERFRDIGTMKCLGATSRFIRQIFLLEACVMGLVGGALGVVLGLAVSCATCFGLYERALVLRTLYAEMGALSLAAAQSLLAALVLSVVSALYPARFAARMVPADALRSNV